MSRQVFVDTSAWIMLLNQSELKHREAVEIYNDLQGHLIYVSNLVIGETYTWLRRKSSFQVAYDFVKSVERKEELKQVKVVYSNRELEQQAIHLLNRYADHRFSYVDAVSICMIRNQGLNKVFSYDRHFTLAGVEQVVY